ncbi:peroxiredoxin-like 2C [Chanos chanos]|uniref:Peroxiredoxin-like 2C n=1 Tax=Chanos chanos TaxID=29144 RepID=A0A6J2WJ48_CHACN|nr:peroxiredoxin-like 2C [Chanos chanos]
MATVSPVTQQIASCQRGNTGKPGNVDIQMSDIEGCLLYNRWGASTTFKSLFQNNKAIIIFVRSFLCHTCKEYVDDLSKVPRDILRDAGVRLIVIGQSSYRHIEPFCSLTGYPHEIYVDPERKIYQKLGMRRGETFMEAASKSPHVKSGLFVGSLRSAWRAMTSPAFDFQGDPLQQGGALIVGPGPEVHFAHFDMNRLDHMPINWLLQLAGLHTVDFSGQPKIIDI